MARVCYRRGVIRGSSPDLRERIFIRQGCGYCDWCLTRRCRRWLKRISRTAQAHGLTRMLTLTLDPAKLADNEILTAAQHLRDTWAKFRTYLARRHGESLRFIAVVEMGHRTSHLHLHVLVGQYIPQQWVSEVWNTLGGGRIVDIRYVDAHNVARYLAKYVTKGSFPRPLLRRLRQFTASVKTWVDVKVKKDWSWSWMQCYLDDIRPGPIAHVSSKQFFADVMVAFGLTVHGTRGVCFSVRNGAK